MLRHEILRELGERPADSDADYNGLENCHGRIIPALFQSALLDNDEHEHSENGTDGIDDNALPFHNRRHLAAGFDEAKKRRHHRRAGHDKNCSEKRANLPMISKAHPGRDGGQPERDHHRNGAKTKDRRSGFLKFRDFQGQASFEKNDRHKKSHQTQQRRFVGEIIIDTRPRKLRQRKTKDEKEKDRGKFQSPGGPLSNDAKK